MLRREGAGSLADMPGYGLTDVVRFATAMRDPHNLGTQSRLATWLYVDVTATAAEDSSALRHMLISGIGVEYASRLFLLEDLFNSNHPTHESHAYLPFIGVDPSWQNRGVGTALMSHRLRELDAAGTEAERAWTDLVGADAMDTVRVALAAYANAPIRRPRQPHLWIRFA